MQYHDLGRNTEHLSTKDQTQFNSTVGTFSKCPYNKHAGPCKCASDMTPTSIPMYNPETQADENNPYFDEEMFKVEGYRWFILF